MQRIKEKRTSIELYETMENLYCVREKYMEAFEKLKSEENIIIIDGDKTEEVIANEIWNEIAKIKKLELVH